MKINKIKNVNPCQWKLISWTFTMSIGFYYLGYNLVIVGPLQDVVLKGSTPLGQQQAIAGSMFFVGCIISCLVSGPMIGRLTKRKVLLLNGIVGILGMALMMIEGQIILPRLIQGLASGIYAAVVPQLVAETTPKSQNGKYGCLYHVFLPVGISSCFLLGASLPTGNQQSDISIFMIFWPAILVLLQIILILQVYTSDTPHEMLLRKENEDKVIQQLSKCYNENEIPIELESIKMIQKEGEGKQPTVYDLFSKQYRRQLIIGLTFSLAFQVTGVNYFQVYMIQILTKLGNMYLQKALFWSSTIGFIMILGNFFCLVITEKLGKKKVLLIGLGGQMLSFVLLMIKENSEINDMMEYVLCFWAFCFSASIDSLMYVILADLLPPVGYGLCIGITMFISFIIVFIGPGLIDPPLTFFGLVFILLILLAFTFAVFAILLPDTTGLNFQQVYQLFQQKNQKNEPIQAKEVELKNGPILEQETIIQNENKNQDADSDQELNQKRDE